MQSTTELIRQQLTETWEQIVTGTVAFAPKLLTALVLIVLAFLVAKIIAWVLTLVLKRVHFDTLLERVGLTDAIKQIGITAPPSVLVPKVAYYLLLFLFARTLADNLGLEPISQALGGFLAYVPNMVSAFLILIIGSTVSQFVGNAVAQAAEASGLDFGPSLGRLLSGLILFIAILMAVAQLRIDTEIVRIVTIAGFAGLSAAFALSFGLGTRDVTRAILAGFYARRVLTVGHNVEVAGESGTLKAVTPTLLVLERGDETITVSNNAILDQPATMSPTSKSASEETNP